MADGRETFAGFSLGEPVLVCRWRMAGKEVPLLNRHIRALAHRRVAGAPVGDGLLAWAKQHVEWSVAGGDYETRDGVLMTVVDVAGNAAMSVGEYRPLDDTSLPALAARAAAARVERNETGVAPELLAAAGPGRILLQAAADEPLCGVASLVEQLAQVRGVEVARVPELAAGALVPAHGAEAPEAPRAPFLISDEHGVVPATGAAGPDPAAAALVRFLADGYAKLFA